jgi:hypothetical protein
MALRALTLRRPARRDPEEEEANQDEGRLGGWTGRTIPAGGEAWSCAEAKKDWVPRQLGGRGGGVGLTR